MGANVESSSDDLATVAIDIVLASVRSRRVRGLGAEGWHDVFGKHLLCLNALPVVVPAEIRDDRQFPDATLRLQVPNLLDHLVRRADEGNFLLDDYVVGQFQERFHGAAGVKTITFFTQ